MRKVDIVIELDESTLKNLNNWFEQVQQCNPRYVEFGSKELADGNCDMVTEWDKQGKLRNRFMGEIGRQGSRLLKPVEINYTIMIKILDQWIEWFCYKLDMLKKNHRDLKKSVKENALVKTPNCVLQLSNGSIVQMKKLIEEVTEFKMLFIWCNEFSIPALNSNPMPDVKHCTWMLSDLNYCEHPENKRKNKFQFYK